MWTEASAPLQRPRPKGSHDGKGVVRILPYSTLPLQALHLRARQSTRAWNNSSYLQSFPAPCVSLDMEALRFLVNTAGPVSKG